MAALRHRSTIQLASNGHHMQDHTAKKLQEWAIQVSVVDFHRTDSAKHDINCRLKKFQTSAASMESIEEGNRE